MNLRMQPVYDLPHYSLGIAPASVHRKINGTLKALHRLDFVTCYLLLLLVLDI